jgi:hypothetical protein
MHSKDAFSRTRRETLPVTSRLATAKNREFALIAILSFVSAAIASATIWENGDIELKWYPIKAWAAFDFPALPANHHNLRWGITLPSTLFVILFGDSPRAYLTLNYLIFALGTVGFYRLVREITSVSAAAATFTIWFLNPIVYSLASNLMPELFSMFYLVVALSFLHAAYLSNSRSTYAVSIIFFVFAYGAKETNIFFIPGLALYELLRRRYNNFLTIAFIFGGCIAVETAVIDILLRNHGILLGRAQVITHGAHVADMQGRYSDLTPLDLLRRWWFNATTNFDRLEYYSKLLYFVFFGQSAWYLIFRSARANDHAVTMGPQPETPNTEFIFAVLSVGLSFAFFTTFFVISLRPFIMGQPLNDRYLWVLLVAALLLLSQLLDVMIVRISKTFFHHALGSRTLYLVSLIRSFIGSYSIVLALAGIIILGTLSRVLISSTLVKVRRAGSPLPYSYLNVNEYYSSGIKQRLINGCTLIFATPRAAWSALMFAFHHRFFKDPLAFYDAKLDQLRTQNDGVIHGWEPGPDDWEGLSKKPHVVPYARPGGTVWEIYAIRLATGSAQSCDKAYYLGHVEMHPRDQELGDRVVSNNRSTQ